MAANTKEGGKNRKYGRNQKDCTRYAMLRSLEVNKARNVMRHVRCMGLDPKYQGCIASPKGSERHPIRPVRFIPTAAPVFNTTETNMRKAMLASLTKPDVNRKLGRIVVNAEAKHHPGLIKLGKGWNAHLSKRTYDELKVRCGL